MALFDYAEASVSVRDDITHEHAAFWQRLASPGSWWTGAQRVAIAQASRDAAGCALCQQRKQALSIASVPGEHLANEQLPAAAVDAVHRIVTDQTRITQSYVDGLVERGVSKEQYVELVGVVVAVFSIDEFHHALGVAVEPLPVAQPGEPSRHRPELLADDLGFVPTIPPEGAVGPEADLWPTGGRAPHVVRALTLVPDALRDWRALSGAQYLSFAGMGNFGKDDARSINRMQMELIAGRVSSVNECFY